MSIKIQFEIIGDYPEEVTDQLVQMAEALTKQYFVVPGRPTGEYGSAPSGVDKDEDDAPGTESDEKDPAKERIERVQAKLAEADKKRKTTRKKPKEPQPEGENEAEEIPVGIPEELDPPTQEEPAGDPFEAEKDPEPEKEQTPEEAWAEASDMLMKKWQAGDKAMQEKVAAIIQSYGAKMFKDIPKDKGPEVLAKAKELV